MEKHPSFLPEKYPDLVGSKPVERAVKKARLQREKVSDTKQERVGTYMERLEYLTGDERGFELLKHKILDRFALNAKDEPTLTAIAEDLYESEKKIAIEQGRAGDVERFESSHDVIEHYKPLIREKAEIQRKTLSSWLDYLQENDAEHPMWFRYFVVRSLEKMGTLDKEKQLYTKRTPTTVSAFPELNSEALGWVYKRLSEGADATLSPEKQKALEPLIKAKDFGKLYAFAQIETAGRLNRESLEGEWRKYEQGSDYLPLENDLQGKGTGWCTAEGSAEAHLEHGDFYVYYTKGDSGAYTEPRAAIRMEGEQMAEVRGVNPRQELEPELVDAAQEKYHNLPGGASYDKKASDMKGVTKLVKKQEKGEPFTKDELIFLYEINSTIEGFGYEKDPRVKELRDRRNRKEDAPIVLDCQPNEIAWKRDEIKERTKVYIGDLFPGVFKLPLEHIYTSFPEGKLQKYNIELGGKTKDELKAELSPPKYYISDWANQLLEHSDFTVLEKTERADLVRLTVKDLGFDQGATTDEVYKKAEEFGLELCPAEAGPRLRLSMDDPTWMLIAMKQIRVRGGDPRMFNLHSGGDGLRLDAYGAGPEDGWDAGSQFVFLLRKRPLETQSL